MTARAPKSTCLSARKTVIAKLVAQLFVGGMVLGAAMPATAASCTWNPASGNWAATFNWLACATGNGNPAGTPGAADSASIAAARTVTINTGQSILTLSNAGTINIDAFGLNLVGGGSTTNSGTINVGGPITANIGISGGHNINNTGGTINIASGSVVNQFGSTITGGTLATTGTGELVVFGNNSLSGVTLNGTLNAAANTVTERIQNGLTLNGTVKIDSSSLVNLEGTQTVGGTGSFVFGGSGNNRLGVDGGGITATLGANVTVRGVNGTIGVGQLLNGSGNTLLNQGLISSDSGGTINLAGAALINQNIIQATGAGSLLRLDTAVDNTGGTLRSTAGGVVLQNGVTVSGGNITNSGGATYQINGSGFNFLSGVTLTNGSTIDMASATATGRVINGITVNGAININNSSLLNFEGNQTLAGAGSIVFGATGNNRVGVDGGGKTLTVASGVTISGANGTIGPGQLVNGSGNAIINNGTLSANVAGGTIAIAGLDAGLTNNGTISALNGGTIALQSNLIGGIGGQLAAGAGSVISQQGVTISGIVNTSGGGSLRPTNSGNNSLSGVTLNGNLDMASATALERVINNLMLNGAININNGSLLNFEGNQTLAGAGSIVFGATGNNRVGVDGGGKTLTVASGVTISGESGTIGLGQLLNGSGNAIVNNGTINSNGGGTIVIAGLDAGIINNGLLRAQNGTLNVSTALSGSGTLQVDATGVMNLANGAKAQGTLAMGAAGAALNLGTGNLTLNTDYTNVAAGSGNAFNRRAGVTGAGLIVSGGDAAQAITGSNVTNGNTTNATLTLGNMRVGSTTFNYQVANTGTTGPSLRGAIQTAVSGGNITDARLSGAGVTASNYNSGAPGGNTGNLGVTFTAATAGTLAALSGQVLNLRSNFENIADQKLNIVLGAGAAAFNAAGGSATPSPATVANQRVGGGNTTTLTVTNTAAAGAFSEDLNASLGASTGAASGSGSITGRLAGPANNNTGTGAMTVAVNTGSAGAKTGTVTLNYDTAGAVAGVSNGLGTASVGSQVITVNGNVYQVAQPTALPANVSLGNFRAGTAQSQTVTLTNTNVAPGFQEGLNATIGTLTGAATGTGGLNNVAAGSSGSLQIGVTGVAGINTGTVQVQLATNGTGTSGLGNLNLGSAQTITVSGAGYRLAGADTIGAVAFGNVHVGDSVAQALSVKNNAVNDGFSEKLNASFGSVSDARITTSGTISQLGAQATNATSLIVGLNTSAAGNVNGTARVLLTSDGAGTSGLGQTALTAQDVGVSGSITTSGSVFRLASASPATPNPVSFGNVRVGAITGQALTLTNTAANDGFSEKLNASIGGATTGVTSNNGAFTLLAAQTSNSASLRVGLDTASAGAKSGTATITLASDGTGTSGLGVTPLTPPTQTVTITGAVYREAAVATTSVTPAITLAARVGGAASGAITVTNNSVDGFTEGLNVTRGATAAGFTSSGGPITNLAATASSSVISVALNTGTAGTFNGNQVLALASNGAITGNADDNTLGTKTVALNGKVYTAAAGIVIPSTTTVDFGIVRIGDVVSTKNVTVQNTANVTALNDSLRGTLSGVGGPFTTASNTVGGIGANATGNIAVGLNTATAGISNLTGSVSMLSQDADLADASAGANASVLFHAQVNNLANAHFGLFSGVGVLTNVGSVFTLDLGNIFLNSSDALRLRLDNFIGGPADDLSGGVFNAVAASGFTFSGFGPLGTLAAGASSGDLNVSFLASGLGMFTDTVGFDGFSTNASGPALAQHRTLIINANVINASNSVPEPGTLALLLMAAAGAALARRRRTMAR